MTRSRTTSTSAASRAHDRAHDDGSGEARARDRGGQRRDAGLDPTRQSSASPQWPIHGPTHRLRHRRHLAGHGGDGETAVTVAKAIDGVKSSFTGLTSTLDSVKGAFVAFAAVAAGAGAFDKSISKTIAFTGEVVALAKQLGITTEEASGLNVALGQVGTDAETYLGALQKLTRQVREHEEASTRMGIKTRDSNGQFLNGRALMDRRSRPCCATRRAPETWLRRSRSVRAPQTSRSC